MWSWSDLKGRFGRRADGADAGRAGLPPSRAITLDLDELIRMRGRKSGFGSARPVHGFRPGDRPSRRRGTGLELDSIGPYQWGDDIRQMDWFATARTGRPQVRQFRQDVQQTIVLLLDLRPSMIFGSSRRLMAKTACLAAAKIAWSTSYDHQPFGLLIAGSEVPEPVPPRRGRRARLQHLARIVAAYRSALERAGEPGRPLADAIEPLTGMMAGDVEGVIVSDFGGLGEGFERRIREAGSRGSLSAVVVEDGLMQAAPPAGVYPYRAAAGQAPSMLAIRAGDENVYRDRAEAHRHALTARLLGLGMREVMIADPATIGEGWFR